MNEWMFKKINERVDGRISKCNYMVEVAIGTIELTTTHEK